MARTRFEPRPMSLVPSMVETGGGPLKLPETALALPSMAVEAGGLTRGCLLRVGVGAGTVGREAFPRANFGSRSLPPTFLRGAREEGEAGGEAG